MINYFVYSKDESTIINNKPFMYLEGEFTEEDNAKIFLDAIRKARPSKNITYFIDKWDTEKMEFVK